MSEQSEALSRHRDSDDVQHRRDSAPAHSQADDLLAAAAALAWSDGEAEERTYGRLAFDAEAARWVISELAPQVAIRAKRIFARISSTQVGSYTFADNDEVRAEL